MKKQLLKSALIAIAGIGLLAGGALAFEYEIGSGSSVTGPALVDDGDGLVMQYALSATLASEAFDINVGESYTFNFAKFWTSDSWINGDDKNPESIYANIVFEAPDVTGTVPGTSVGFSGALSFTQGWKLTWNDPIYITLGNGQEFSVDLSDGSFSRGLWLGPGGNYCSGVNVTATVTHLSDPVPEPTTMLLFGTGVLGLAAVSRRRKA